MRSALTLCLLLLTAATAQAQALGVDRGTPPFPTAHERRAADIASWATVVTTLALDTRSSCLKAEDKRMGCGLEVVRLTTTFLATWVTKKIVNRTRPCAPACGIDSPQTSFPSQHVAFAFSAIGGPRLSVTLPLGTGTATGRIGAGKHYLTDVLAGAGIGALFSRIR